MEDQTMEKQTSEKTSGDEEAPESSEATMAEQFRELQRQLQEEKTRRKEEETRRKEEETRRKEEETRRKEIETRLKQAEKQLAKTSFVEFLDICHRDVFQKLKVQQIDVMTTGGGLTNVAGKLYPRHIKLWAEFDGLFEQHFAILERVFGDSELLPSPAGLSYLSSKLSNLTLASEEDLKNFECLAVEGCVLDLVPQFFGLVRKSKGKDPATDGLFSTVGLPSTISFSNYPFGVVASESDEEGTEEETEGEAGEANKDEREDGESEQREPSRGRTRVRPASRKRKPLVIKDDRPAYIGALAVAKSDMDAALARATQAEQEEDEHEGSRGGSRPSKRRSPDRTKVRPDQWCFWHGEDDKMRPLFVVEYKAAHKVSSRSLREHLGSDAAASLMEDAVRELAEGKTENTEETEQTEKKRTKKREKGKKTKKTVNPKMEKRDIAHVLTQAYHYMVDYGLPYCYATAGHSFIFLYLDATQPSTLFYRFEEPAAAVEQAGNCKRSAVALVMTFILMSLQGKCMSQAWKKHLDKTQPRWPTAYGDMNINSAGGASADASNAPHPSTTVIRLAPQTTTTTHEDPQKRGQHQDQPQEEEKMALSECDHSTLAPLPSPWPSPSPSPVLAYCTQACLLGLKRGGFMDPRCPNIRLHRQQRGGRVNVMTNMKLYDDHDDNDNDNDDYDNDNNNDRHPISLEQLRELLTEQLARDLDHDCDDLEEYGMYGAIGVLFRITLRQYGYCFVGKGVQRVHRKRLEREELAYGLLDSCQGRLVPVNLGVIQLVDEYWTRCGAHVSHMMLMSFAGRSFWYYRRQGRKASDGPPAWSDAEQLLQLQETLDELEEYGVLHDDVRDANMVWNVELQRIMAIDLEYVSVQEHVRVEDGQKRKTVEESGLHAKRVKV